MADFLTDDQRSRFRHLLLERLRRGVNEDPLGADSQHFADLAGEVHDTEEESVASVMVDLELASIERQANEARDVESALLRLDQGTYGICVDCDLPIPFARLEANPTAERCLPCQMEFERAAALEQPFPPPPSL